MKLTDEMREWLRRPEIATMPCWDMIGLFLRDFQLNGEQAGEILAQWCREAYSMPPWRRTLGECAPTSPPR